MSIRMLYSVVCGVSLECVVWVCVHVCGVGVGCGFGCVVWV